MSRLLRLATADFRDRVRRPAYVVILCAAVGLGHLATPGADAGWVVMQVGTYRGEYNSAYIGMVVALASAMWLSLGGFYVVRDAIARDHGTGVGRLLATTPLRTTAYLAAKFLSSVLVLASMLGVLVLTALFMQLARGEVTAVDPVALVSPFVLIALPLMAFTAGAALLFEAIPLLRAGFGNIVWFFGWMYLAVGGQSGDAPLGGIGVHDVVRSLTRDMTAQGVDLVKAGEFSLGLTMIDAPLTTFVWHGFDPDAGYLTSRLAIVVLAVTLALVPALWFPRFDPSRGRQLGKPTASLSADNTSTLLSADNTSAPPHTTTTSGTSASASFASAPRTPVELGSSTLRLLTGQTRVLLQGIPRWWWGGVVTVTGVSPLATGTAAHYLLILAWIWPVLIWSRLGAQSHGSGVDSLLGAYPSARRRIAAEWLAGFLLTAVSGLGPAVRMAVGADGKGLVHWSVAALAIPSLALLLGTVSHSPRLFQVTYLPLWFATVNGIAPLDYMGALRTADGTPAGMPPLFLLTVTAAMLTLTFLTHAARRAAS
ncbi:ABC transporter permease [Streptomyces sp. NPDC088745]|uniref:ABC transporter permease n=1 Tax=Streptomyces sp. NPDC088745 TaxID=3365884 RepID=UPI00382CC541